MVSIRVIVLARYVEREEKAAVALVVHVVGDDGVPGGSDFVNEVTFVVMVEVAIIEDAGIMCTGIVDEAPYVDVKVGGVVASVGRRVAEKADFVKVKVEVVKSRVERVEER